MTALGLHGDTVHPAGNLVFGRVFGILAAYTWKRWRTQINRWGPLGGGSGVSRLPWEGWRTDRQPVAEGKARIVQDRGDAPDGDGGDGGD